MDSDPLRRIPQLLEELVLTTGTRAAHADRAGSGTRTGSRPPTDIHRIDVVREAGATLSGWAEHLVREYEEATGRTADRWVPAARELEGLPGLCHLLHSTRSWWGERGWAAELDRDVAAVTVTLERLLLVRRREQVQRLIPLAPVTLNEAVVLLGVPYENIRAMVRSGRVQRKDGRVLPWEVALARDPGLSEQFHYLLSGEDVGREVVTEDEVVVLPGPED